MRNDMFGSDDPWNEEIDPLEIEMLREQLRDWYGTAAAVMDDGMPFGSFPPLMELAEVDAMSDEEILEKARSLGMI